MNKRQANFLNNSNNITWTYFLLTWGKPRVEFSFKGNVSDALQAAIKEGHRIGAQEVMGAHGVTKIEERKV